MRILKGLWGEHRVGYERQRGSAFLPYLKAF
jgi:hypothetical protein